MTLNDRAAINLIGANLASLRAIDETALLVTFGSIGPSTDCPNGNMLVTIRKGFEEATSEAVDLQDAIFLARAKVDAQIEAKRKVAEEAKRKEVA